MALAPRRDLLGGAVQVDQGLVDGGLIQDIHADQALGDLGVDVLHSLFHALAVVAALVAVPQLAGLIDAGGSAGGNSGTAHGAILQVHLDLNGGVAAAVQDLTAQDVNDLDHLLHGNQSPFQNEAELVRQGGKWIIKTRGVSPLRGNEARSLGP